MKKNKKIKINNGHVIGIVCGLVVVVAVVVIIIINANSKKINNDVKRDKDDNKIEYKVYTEKDLIDAFGMSIKDAEELVMTAFLSDNFECSTKIEADHYRVTVKDVLSGDEFLYDVNPASGEFVKIG